MQPVHGRSGPRGLVTCGVRQGALSAFAIVFRLQVEPLGKHVMVVNDANKILQGLPRFGGGGFVVANLVEDLDSIAEATRVTAQAVQFLGVELRANFGEAFVKELELVRAQGGKSFADDGRWWPATADQAGQIPAQPRDLQVEQMIDHVSAAAAAGAGQSVAQKPLLLGSRRHCLQAFIVGFEQDIRVAATACGAGQLTQQPVVEPLVQHRRSPLEDQHPMHHIVQELAVVRNHQHRPAELVGHRLLDPEDDRRYRRRDLGRRHIVPVHLRRPRQHALGNGFDGHDDLHEGRNRVAGRDQIDGFHVQQRITYR